MKVVILCGGKGTRLKEYTEDIPKPLVEVGGKPILWHIMKIYSHYGFNEFVLCLGYKGEKIKEYFKENKEGWKIEFADTGEESSKSERLKKIKDYINEDLFLVAYGDDVCDVNLKEVVKTHKSHGKITTLTAIPLYSQFGIVETNRKNEVVNFKEKPRLDNYWFNGGFFVFDRKIFDYLDIGELENEVFERLVQENQIIAYKHDGFWKCMNTFKDTQELNKLWNEHNAPWKVWRD